MPMGQESGQRLGSQRVKKTGHSILFVGIKNACSIPVCGNSFIKPSV